MSRVLSSIMLLLLNVGILHAQVPPGYDLSQAKPWRTVWKVTIGRDGGTVPLYIRQPCGATGRSMLLAGSSNASRSFWTEPRIDTSQHGVLGWGDYNLLYDYDGVDPLEYMNESGDVDQCLDSTFPFKKQPVDQIYCFGIGALSDAFSADVDGDGYLDVVCDISGGSKAFKVISGGPEAGKGCERTTAFDVPSPGSEYNTIDALYRSVTGQWRMIHYCRDRSNEYLILHEVRFSRTSPRGDGLHASFTALDTIFTLPGDVGRPSTIGSLVVVQDTILKRDYMVLFYKPGFTQWVTERFDLTEGEFNASGEQVAGIVPLEMMSFGHSLGTQQPVVMFSTERGALFSYAADLTRAIARWIPTNTGTQPVAGMVVINDQTGDGMPDIAISGGNPAVLLLVTLDTTIVSVDEQHIESNDFRAGMSGTMLSVQTTRNCSITIDIATVDGRAVYTSPLTPIETGEYRQDLAPMLQPLAAGAYFVRVRCDAQMVTIPIQR
jgi:hypothetical protein